LLSTERPLPKDPQKITDENGFEEENLWANQFNTASHVHIHNFQEQYRE